MALALLLKYEMAANLKNSADTSAQKNIGQTLFPNKMVPTFLFI